MYEKQTWATGETITEEKLNHMEDGIASGGMFVVGSTYDESTQITTLDKTYKEIVDAFSAGQNVILKSIDGDMTDVRQLVSYGSLNNMFRVGFFDFYTRVVIAFKADSENGYPATDEIEV